MKKRSGSALHFSFRKALPQLLVVLFAAIGALPLAAAGPTQVSTQVSLDVCESRRPLTLQERETAMMFNADLSWLDPLRAGPDRRGINYQQKMQFILSKNTSKFTSDELKDVAAEFLLMEQFKQLMFETAGVQNSAFVNFIRVQRDIEFFGGSAPRELREAVTALQMQIYSWSETQQATLVPGLTNRDAISAAKLQILSRTENVLALLQIVTQTLSHRLDVNSAQLDDQMAAYRQYFSSLFGGGAVVGAMAVSTPVVTAAGASAGAVGVLLSGCSVGAIGGGAASMLQLQYESYSNAWIESANHHTSYACELRRAVESSHQNLFQAFAEGASHGAVAGCIFTSAGMIAPKMTVYTVVGAVSIATGAETVMAANDGYLATRSYLVYRSLLSLQKAEASTDQPAQAAEHLRQAQAYAQQSGAHALNAILVGIVLVGGPKEIQHAIAHGREAIVALIGKSSDNAAVAVNLLTVFAQPRREHRSK